MKKDKILSALDKEQFYREHLKGFIGQGKQQKALCPFHDDHNPSLSVNFDTGEFNCFACGINGSVIDFVMKYRDADFKEALEYLTEHAGLSPSVTGKRSAAKLKQPSQASQDDVGKHKSDQDRGNNVYTLQSIKERYIKGGFRFIRIHEYTSSSPMYIKAIYRNPRNEKQARFYTLTDKNKGLYIDKRTSAPVLYNQDALSKNTTAPIIWVEGEKDVDTLTSLQLISVTAGGVNDWRSEFSQHFRARHIIIVPDNDGPGEKHAATVSGSLNGIAASVKILKLQGLPVKGDISDWIEQRRGEGKTEDAISQEIKALIEESAPISAVSWTDIPEGWPYFIDYDGNLCKLEQKKEGSIPVRLCNFDAAITQEIIEDDGTENLKWLYVVEGKRGTINLHPLEVPHSKYEALTWHRMWNARTVIEPGIRVKDLVRHAVETRSRTRITRRVYTHTGFREIGGKKVFLSTSGAIGSDMVEVKLPEELKRYCIPRQPENEIEAIKTSLKCLDIAKHEITLPLWLMTYLAPLTSTLIPMFTGYLYGERDTYKTTLAVMALSHYGDFLNKVGMLNFNDTSGSILQKAFILKDVLTVIDDFHPSPNKYESDKMQALNQNIIRSVGNRTGRARLNSDATPQARYYPRGVVIVTAEKLPSVQSTRTRTLTIEIKRGDVTLDMLSDLQGRSALLPHAMSSFIHWLLYNLDWIEVEKTQQIHKFRSIACQENSHKLSEHISYLQYTALLVCNWLIDRKCISTDQAEDLQDEARNLLLNLSRDTRQLIEDEDPVTRFTEILQTLIYQGIIRLQHRDYEQSCMGNINGRPIGFYDDDWLYFIPEALWREIEVRCRETGSTFPTDRTTLFKTLKNRGLTKTDQKHKTRLTNKVWLHGESKWVLQLNQGCLSQEVGSVGRIENNDE